MKEFEGDIVGIPFEVENQGKMALIAGDDDLDLSTGFELEQDFGIDTNNTLGLYLAQVSRYEIFTVEQERVIFDSLPSSGNRASADPNTINAILSHPVFKDDKRKGMENMRVDSRDPREFFVNGNLRLVVAIAKRFRDSNHTLSLLDLIQAGNEGLMVAYERYDPEFKNEEGDPLKFSTYGSYWIKQRITKSIMNEGDVIRKPTHMHDTVRKVKRVADEFLLSNGTRPTRSELEELLSERGFMPSQIDAYFGLSDRGVGVPKSLDRAVFPDDSITLGEVIDSKYCLEDEVVTEVFKDELRAVVEQVLDPRLQQVIVMRFGLDGEVQTLRQIGELLGVSHERVRQLEVIAMEKLRVSSDFKMFINEIESLS